MIWIALLDIKRLENLIFIALLGEVKTYRETA